MYIIKTIFQLIITTTSEYNEEHYVLQQLQNNKNTMTKDFKMCI